jgi:hypothetical protein
MAKALRPLTPVGKKIMKRLIDLEMSQADFCRQHNMAANQFSCMIRSNELHRNLLKQTCDILNIKM